MGKKKKKSENCVIKGKREREREREREIYGRGDTKINDREDVKREKVKGKEKK